jgi:3-oxoadipate enol-lactonase
MQHYLSWPLITATLIPLLFSFARPGEAPIDQPLAGGGKSEVASGRVRVDGGELYYEMKGEGRTVVLLHGGLLDRRMWDGQFELLAKQYRVIRYDARGHGLSSVPTGDFAHYEDLHKLVSALGISRATFVGLSLGARTAIDFALADPEMVEALVAVAPGMSGWEFKDPVLMKNQESIRKAIEANDDAMFVEWFIRSWTDGPKRAPEQVDAKVREKVRTMARETFSRRAGAQGKIIEVGATGRVGELRVPVLAIVGDLDMSDIHGIVDLLVAKVPGAKKLVIPGVAHMVNLEKPAEFNKALLDFLLRK